MKIIEPSFNLSISNQNEGIQMLKSIETHARISHRSDGTEDTWEKFITAVVLNHGDWSVTEHESVSVTIRTDRGITHELVRHRLFSFTQESTRFVRYGKKVDLEFIRPVDLPSTCWDNWEKACAVAEKEYFNMLTGGARPQEARSVLPQSTAATIVMTGNLRNWRHFFLMRTSKESHPDMRRITVPMLRFFQDYVPLLFSDIEPEKRQIENMRLPR